MSSDKLGFVPPSAPRPILPPAGLTPVSNLETLAQSRADGRAIPTVPRPLAPDGGDVRQFVFQAAKLNNGDVFPVAVAGDYIYLVSSTAECLPRVSATGIAAPTFDNTLTAKDDNGNLVNLEKTGKGYYFPRPFTKLDIQLSGAMTSCAITFYVGFGRLQDEHDGQIVVGSAGVNNNTIVRPANTTAYAAGQVVSTGAGAFFPFNPFRVQNGKAIFTKLTLLKSTNVTLNADFTLFLFQENTQFAAPVDQAAFNPLFTDLVLELIGQVRFPSFIAIGANAAICELDGIAVPVWNTAAAPNPPRFCYGVLVANAPYVPGNAEQFAISSLADSY